MSGMNFPVNRQIWLRFVEVVKAFVTSNVGGKAIWLSIALIALLLAVNGFNVVNSYVGRDFMSAIAERDQKTFIWQGILYVGVFAVSTVVAVLHRYAEDNLGILFREWLTKHSINGYIDNRTYYRLKVEGDVENPDERIADDVRTYTVTTLSIVLMLLNASVTVIAFSGVLWTISPPLFFIAITYALLGSILAIKFGRPLIGLNSKQLDKEADFRSALIHVRANAESIALSRREGRLKARLLQRVDALADNLRQTFVVSRNLNFFSTGYFNLVQIIPIIIVAPLFFQAKVEFGVVTQSAMAFAQLVGAFSLIVSQFGTISSFTAVLSRLNRLWEAMDHPHDGIDSKIEIIETTDRQITYENLTLRSLDNDRLLLKSLSLSIPHGTRLLITGPNEDAKLALFRATASIFDRGEGKIIRPSLDSIRFLPQRAYLYPGTLRELLMRSGEEHTISDERMLTTMRELGLGAVLSRVGGLDVEQDWESLLSLGEEQTLAFTRLVLAAPQFAFLDRVYTALKPDQAAQLLLMLSLNSITYVALDEATNMPQLYDAILEIEVDGSWKVRNN
ncbi:MAG: ABC transporter ATP-binding protein/permease [Candidatus Methylumidiphilus sp.]